MESICGVCFGSIVIDDVSVVNCYGPCGKKFHTSCINLKKAIVTFLKSCPNLQWYCDGCLPSSLNAVMQKITDCTDAVNKMTAALLPITQSIALNVPKPDKKLTPALAAIFRQAPSREVTPKRSRTEMEESSSKFISKQKLIFGTKDAQIGEPISLPDTRRPQPQPNLNMKSIFVSRLHPRTSCEEIINYLLSIQIDVTAEFKCTKLVKLDQNLDGLRFVSFKLTVPATCFKALVDPSIWPKSVAVREFEFHTRPFVVASLPPPAITTSSPLNPRVVLTRHIDPLTPVTAPTSIINTQADIADLDD